MNLSTEEKSIIDSILYLKGIFTVFSNFPVVLIYHLPKDEDFNSKSITEMREDSLEWIFQNWTSSLFIDILNVINKLEDKGYVYIDKAKGRLFEEYIQDDPTLYKNIPKLLQRDKMTNAQLLRHMFANIHVYPNLADLKSYDYKTIEDRQLEEAQKQTKIAHCQTTIVIVTLIITLLIPIGDKIYNCYTAKKESKIKVEIENFQDFPKDTIILEK